MKKYVCLALAAALCLGIMPAVSCSEDDGRTDYTMDIEYAEGTLKGVCRVNYYNASAATDVIAFNLYGNAFRKDAAIKPVANEQRTEVFWNGESYGSMTVTEVEGAKEWQICGNDCNILEVTLPETLKSGGRAEVAVTYQLQLAEADHRTGITEHTVNLGNFYPAVCARDKEGGYIECEYYSSGDPFISECADYAVTLKIPEGFTAATSGQLTGESENGGTYALNNARDFCIVLSDEFETASADVNGTRINYMYYDDDSERVLNAVSQSFSYFESLFGEYEYPQLTVVQTGFFAGGMEYPALVMVSDKLTGDDAVYAAVHETAHQWWYAMVGSDQINCAWQDEGLTEYSTLCFFEGRPDYGYTRAGIVRSARESYRACYTVYGQLFGEADTTMNRSLKDFRSDYEYVNIAYNKGLLLFDALRESMGDEKFFAALKSYFAENNGGIAEQSALEECFRMQSKDAPALIESFVTGKIII